MKLLVIACSVLKNEFLATNPDGAHIEFLEQGLHQTPDRMRVVIQEKIDEARLILTEALANSSEDAELLILLAKVKRHQQDLAGAIELYLKAKAFSERLSEASIDLAEIYYYFGLEERAQQELLRASFA